MKNLSRFLKTNRSGAALIISMIFIVVFSTLAVSLAAMSGTNLKIADNQKRMNSARTCAESGLEIIRYWFSHVAIPGDTANSARFAAICNKIQDDLTANGLPSGYATFTSSTITVPTVTLDSAREESFSAFIEHVSTDTISVAVTGTSGNVSKTITAQYNFDTRANNVFDYGVATKGPLNISGNIDLTGVNIAVEASVYIETDAIEALSIIGNSQIAGDVSITNSLASVNLQGGQASIGGETGDTAIDEHVFFGVPPTEFPEPQPSLFSSYATNIVDSTTDTSSDVVLENVRIVAGTNPSFSGSATLRGVLYIETPNVVTFTGNADVTAIIVGDGDITDNSATNQINFSGSVISNPISSLPQDAQFSGLHDETGTFVIAPGFKLSFGGNFNTLSGAIAGNGIEFYGNAGGIIEGSVLNYSDESMTLSGNSDLQFNRSGITEVPAGFVPEFILEYNPSAYSEAI